MSQSTPSRRARWWQVALALSAGLLVCSLLPMLTSSFFAISALPQQQSEATGEMAQALIRQWLGAALPPSATDFAYYYESWTDYFVHARLRIAPDDLTRMLAAVQSDALCPELVLTDEGDASFLRPPDRDWWTPPASGYASGRCGASPRLLLLVDKTQPDQWTIYLEIASA